MAEQIKNFYNNTLIEQATGNVVSNNETTKALIKTITIYNDSLAEGSFDIELDNVTLYEDIVLSGKETIKFENENLVVPQSKVCSITNKSITYKKSQSSKLESRGIYCNIRVLNDNKVIIVYINYDDSCTAYYTIYNADGTVFKDSTRLSSYTSVNAYLDISENDLYIYIFYRGDTVYPFLCTITKTTGTIASNSFLESIANVSYLSLSRFLGSAYIGCFWKQGDGTDIMIATTSNSATPSDDQSIAERSPTSVKSASLSDGNVVVSYDVSNTGYHQVRNLSKTEIVAETQWHSNLLTLYELCGLSNGTFVAVYTDGNNSSYTTLQYFNNDLTVAVAAFAIRNTTTITFQKLTVDSDDNVYIIFQDTADENKFKITSYTSAGVLIAADITLDTMDADETSYEAFDIDSSSNVWAAYYQEAPYADNDTFLDLLIKKNYLNVSVSGVEVTE